jgi:hypothetical protein
MLRRTLVGLVAIGVLGSFMGMGGFSLFTATTDNDNNAFTSGSVEISTSPATAFLHMSNMAPGDQVTAPITVSNDGSLDLRYAVTSTTTEDTLAAQLKLTIKSGVTTCTNADFGGSGTVLYGPEILGTMSGTEVIGDPAPGFQSGDRPLDVDGSEDLCFSVTLRSDAIGPMSAATTATFTFDAEQTTNNP